MNKEMRVMQKKVLYRDYGFRIRVEPGEIYIWHLEVDNIKIIWNIKHQIGSYTIDDGDLNLIFSWQMLEDLMEQILKKF